RLAGAGGGRVGPCAGDGGGWGWGRCPLAGEPMSRVSTMTSPPTPSPGPIFISGRQHSGNTVMAVCLGRAPECMAQIDENAFFEYRALIDKEADPAVRARKVFERMKLEALEVREPALAHMLGMAAADRKVGALELYRAGMDFAMRRLGRAF